MGCGHSSVGRADVFGGANFPPQSDGNSPEARAGAMEKQEEDGHRNVDDDAETYAEMRSLVAAACSLAIQSAEWRANSAWSDFDGVLAGGMADRCCGIAEIRQAAKRRDDVALKTAFNTAAAAVGAGYLAAVRVPIKKVLACCELTKLRRSILDAALQENVNELLDLLDIAESAGEQCGVERDFAAELLDRLPSSAREPVGESPSPSDAVNHECAPSLRGKPGTRAWHLAVLGFHCDAQPTAHELRSAYRRAALQWHPDRPHNLGVTQAAENFRQARDSYDVLRLQIDANDTSAARP